MQEGEFARGKLDGLAVFTYLVRRRIQAQWPEFEARRCLSCGNCFECDGCLGSCPEDAIIKLGKGFRYRFDYEKCTGCATCFEQCPVHAIEMIPEPR